MPAIMHKMVYELRYHYGFTFLDRCGATLNDILRSQDGWVHSDPNPQGGALVHRDTQTQFRFNALSLSLSQTQSQTIDRLLDTPTFAGMADKLTEHVVQNLEISSITRIGFRLWQLIEQSSMEAGREALKRLGVASLERLEQLGVGDIDEVDLTVLSYTDAAMRRIAVLPVEQAVQLDQKTLETAKQKARSFDRKQKQRLLEAERAKRRIHQYPLHSVLVDIDTFVEDPPYPGDMKVSTFIADASKWCEGFAGKLMNELKGG